MAEVCEIHKNKMASVPLQSRESRTVHSLRTNSPRRSRACPCQMSDCVWYSLYHVVLFLFIYGPICFQEKTLCKNARACHLPPPPGLSGPAHDITWHPLWPIATESGRRARRSGSRTPWLFLIGGADVRVPAESLCGGVEKRKYNNHGRRETQGEWRLKTKALFMIS